jgi:hypothetical protein
MTGTRDHYGVSQHSARDGSCSPCGEDHGTIAHVRLGGLVVRLCANCAARLRADLADFAGYEYRRPPKGTPEYAVWLAAIDVALAAPLKQGTNVYAASIPWSIVTDLRAQLAAAGIDWRAQHGKQVRPS